MFICLDKSIGALAASDIELDEEYYILCDGREVTKNEFPKLCMTTLRVPDLRNLLPGVYFYIIGDL